MRAKGDTKSELRVALREEGTFLDERIVDRIAERVRQSLNS